MDIKFPIFRLELTLVRWKVAICTIAKLRSQKQKQNNKERTPKTSRPKAKRLSK